MAIVGGGYIACEFAGIMNGLGTRVILLHRGEQILRGFDQDLRDEVAGAMRARGIALEIQRDVTAVEKTDGGLRVSVDNGETHLVDQVLFATGRRANTKGLGLEALGVRLTADGAVCVDDWSQTAVPSIFAVGDVTDRLQLTPVAIHEGHAFADTVFGGRPRPSDHSLVPAAVFTQPEAATLGLSEADARAKGPVEIYRTRFRPLLNTLAGRQERTMMKLVVDGGTRRVLGVHIVGHGAAEMIQLAAVAVRMGATKDDFDRTMPVHPTSAEELVTMHATAA
jgi:glutathione reductase (NADPH)